VYDFVRCSFDALFPPIRHHFLHLTTSTCAAVLNGIRNMMSTSRRPTALLLGSRDFHLTPNETCMFIESRGCCIFPRGKRSEVSEARPWFSARALFASETDPCLALTAPRPASLLAK